MKTFIKLRGAQGKLKMLKRHKFRDRKATSARGKKETERETQYQQELRQGKKSSHSFSATLNCSRAMTVSRQKSFVYFFSVHSEKSSLIRERRTKK